MESTKKWWVISIATLCVAERPEDSFHYEYYNLSFSDTYTGLQIPTAILLGKFHEFSCEHNLQEKHGNKQKCDYRDYFIQMNKNAKITLEETTKGAEIEIETSWNFITKLTINCLNDNGTFNLKEAKHLAFENTIDICHILKIDPEFFFKDERFFY